MSKKPCILITNDDGIGAPGIHALYQALKSIGDLFVVAPSDERSAVGHAITLSDPLRVWKTNFHETFFGYAVNGTPADCVKIGYWAILKKKPDVLVSGINLGPNTGINTIYSGTVSAATEGAMLGVPSFAISLGTYTDPDFSYAAKFAVKMVDILLGKTLPDGVYLNINVPACPENEIKGVAITRQGLALYKETFDQRIDPHGHTYYWLSGQKVNPEQGLDVDDGAVQANCISITPVHYDLTHYNSLENLKQWKIEI